MKKCLKFQIISEFSFFLLLKTNVNRLRLASLRQSCLGFSSQGLASKSSHYPFSLDVDDWHKKYALFLSQQMSSPISWYNIIYPQLGNYCPGSTTPPSFLSPYHSFFDLLVLTSFSSENQDNIVLTILRMSPLLYVRKTCWNWITANECATRDKTRGRSPVVILLNKG